MTEPARNGPCPCGSGVKWKKCCGSTVRRNIENAAADVKRAAERLARASESLEARERRRGTVRAALAAATLLGLGSLETRGLK